MHNHWQLNFYITTRLLLVSWMYAIIIHTRTLKPHLSSSVKLTWVHVHTILYYMAYALLACFML